MPPSFSNPDPVKGKKSRFHTLFKAQKGLACTAIQAIKVPLKSLLKTCHVQVCSTVLIDHIFFVLHVGVDTTI